MHFYLQGVNSSDGSQLCWTFTVEADVVREAGAGALRSTQIWHPHMLGRIRVLHSVCGTVYDTVSERKTVCIDALVTLCSVKNCLQYCIVTILPSVSYAVCIRLEMCLFAVYAWIQLLIEKTSVHTDGCVAQVFTNVIINRQCGRQVWPTCYAPARLFPLLLTDWSWIWFAI